MAVEQARTMRHKGTVPSRARPLDARAHSSSLPANQQPRAWLQPLPKQSLLVNSTEYKRLETAPVSPIMCHVGFRLRASLVGANNAVPTSGRPRSDIPLCCHLPSTSCPLPIAISHLPSTWHPLPIAISLPIMISHLQGVPSLACQGSSTQAPSPRAGAYRGEEQIPICCYRR